MDELAALQQELDSLQRAPPAPLLSRHNAVNLLHFLEQHHGLRLAHDRTGSHFFTPDKLSQLVLQQLSVY